MVHDDYIVHYHKGDVSVFFTHDQENYDISFGKFKCDDGKLSIFGGRNNIILSDSDLSIHELKINADQLVIEDDCKIKSHLALCSVQKAENYGGIESDAMRCDFAGEQHGFINHGTLNISGQYEQLNGSLVNAGVLHINNLLVEHGGLIWNQEDGEWKVTGTMQVSTEALLADGDMQAKQAIATAELIALKKHISGDVLALAADNIHVYDHADVHYKKSNLFAKENLTIEGKLTHCGEIEAFGKDVHITSSAALTNNNKLTLAAKDVLKCHAKAEINQTDAVTVSAKALFLDNHIAANTTVDINSVLYSILAKDSSVSAPAIRLHGHDHLINGKLSGNLSTPHPIHHLYINDAAQVDQCKHLDAKAVLIDVKGKINAEINDLHAQTVLTTGNVSDIDAAFNQLTAGYILLSGEMNGKEVQASAEHLLHCDPRLDLHAEKITATADTLTLDGVLTGKLLAEANKLFNEAQITSTDDVRLTGHTALVNTEISGIYADRLIQYGKTILDKGFIKTSGKHDETAHELLQDSSAEQDSGDTSYHADSGVLAGKVKAKKTVDAAISESLLFLAPNQIQSESANLLSGSELAGPIHLTTKDGVIGAKHSARIVNADITSTQSMTMTSEHLEVKAAIKTGDLRLVKQTDDNKDTPAHLNIEKESDIKAEQMVENFDKAVIAGKIAVGTAMLNSNDMVQVTPESSLHFDKSMTVKTQKFGFDGRLTSAYQDNTDNNRGLLVEATTAKFGSTTDVNILLPMVVTADKVSYSGSYKAAAMHTRANDTTFAEDCHVGSETWDMTVTGKTENATVTVEQGALIENRQTIIENIKQLNVSGTLASKILSAKLKEVTIAATGKLGSKESELHIDADDFYLYGLLQADVGIIKCANKFIQNGLYGKAKIQANTIDITTPFYLNFLGATEARQASFTSFFASYLGFEFIYSKIDNSVIKVKLLPTFTHLQYMESAIQDIIDGKIDLLDAKHLIYSIQAALMILEPILPTLISKTAGIALNTYSLYQNLTQVKELIDTIDFDNARLVDILPLLVSIKNSASSTVALADNIGSLVTGLEHPVLDAIDDATKYLKDDLWGDIKEFFHFHQSSNDGGEPGKTPDPTPQNNNNKDDGSSTNDPVNKPKRPEKTDPTLSERLKEKYEKFNLYDFSHDALTLIFGLASIVGPSVNEDNILGINLLAPKFTGNSTERSVFNFSWNSPVVGLSSDKTGVAVFQYSNDFAYTQRIRGQYVYLGSDSTHSHRISIEANHLDQADGTKVRSGNVFLSVPEMRAYDIKGDRSTTFKYSTVADGSENEFLTLDENSKFKIYRPDDPSHATINYITDHDYHFDTSTYGNGFTLPWGATYSGTNVTIDKGVNIETKGDTLGFAATEGSITNLGNLKSGDIVWMDAVDKITEDHATTDSKHLSMHARNDVDLLESDDRCEVGAVVSERGSISVLGGDLTAKRSLYLGAHKDIVDNCTVTETGHRSNPKKYRAGNIKGGDGYGYHGVGLYAEADGKVYINGSEIGAIGDYFISGNHGIEADAPHHTVVKKTKHHKLFNTKKKSTVTEFIQRPVFNSDYGYSYLSANRGTIKSLAGKYDANRTFFQSRYAPEFKDIVVNTVTHTSSSTLGIKTYDKLHKEKEHVGQIFLSPEALRIFCKYNDIVIPNSGIFTDYLFTDTYDGRVYIYQDPIEVYDRTKYLTFGLSAGPFNYSHSCNPDDPHPDRVYVQDPLLNSWNGMKHTHGTLGTGSAAVNLADAAAGKASAVLSGNYAGAAGTSVGVKVGHTTTETWSQKFNPNNRMEIGYWDDRSAYGIKIWNMPAAIGTVDMLYGGSFDAIGSMLNYRSRSKTSSVGVSYDVATNTVTGDASFSSSKSSGSYAANCPVHIGRFRARGVNVTADNANIVIDHLEGRIRRADVTSHADTSNTSYTSVSAGTNDTFSVGHGKIYDNMVHHASSLEIGDMTNGQVDEANLIGGKLLGEGLKAKPPTVINSTGIKGSHHESGFGIAVTVNQDGLAGVNNVSYANTTTTQTTGKPARHHGTSFNLNTPMNLFGLFQKPKQQTATDIQDLSEADELQYIDPMQNISEIDVTPDQFDEVDFDFQTGNETWNQSEITPLQSASQQVVSEPAEPAESEDLIDWHFTHAKELEEILDPNAHARGKYTLPETSGSRLLWTGVAGKLGAGLGYGLKGLAVMEDINALDNAWERSTDSYEPVLHEAALIGGKWTGSRIAAGVVNGALKFTSVHPAVKVGALIGSGLVGGDVGEYLVDMSIFSAKTIGGAVMNTYRHPLPSHYIPMMPVLPYPHPRF